MVVNEVDFKRASKNVSDSFKIPWLYSIKALFKGEDVFASLPTRYGLVLFRDSLLPRPENGLGSRPIFRAG